jgi:hypothetical protein
MGNYVSFPFLSGNLPVEEEPEKYIVVPPIISWDRKEIDRMSISTFEWVRQKRELQLLLRQYMQPGASAILNIVPPSEDRLLITSLANFPNINWYGVSGRHGESRSRAFHGAGELKIRAHLDSENPYSFISLAFSQFSVRSSLST